MGRRHIYLNTNMDFYTLLIELGFPCAAAATAGYFVFLTLKFILASVTNTILSIETIVAQLEKRVQSMNHDLHKLDLKVSHAVGLPPNYERLTKNFRG